MATDDISCQHNITSSCTDSSYAKCPHCSLDLCLEHIQGHQNLVRIQFNEMIDRINEQKAESSNHSAINEMRTIALEKLDNWKANQIETVLTIYNVERLHAEYVCEQNITEKSNIQNVVFAELNAASNTIDKKKHIHPRDIVQLEQKLNELNTLIKKIQEHTDAELTTIVTNIELPKTIELEQRLGQAQEAIDTMMQQHQKTMDARDRAIYVNNNEIQRLQHKINEKDQKIEHLKQRLQRVAK